MDSLRLARVLTPITAILTLEANRQAAISRILLGVYTQIEALRQQYQGGPDGFRTALIDL